jgi:probable HAF family extracellular repeat protein
MSRHILGISLASMVFLAALASTLAAEPWLGILDFYPTAISADGNVIVGGSDEDGAIRWTASDGSRSIGALSGDDRSWAWAVSADGSVIAGESGSSAANQAFRWTLNDGMTALGMLGGDSYSIARGIAADGSIIVGESGTSRAREGWKWTAATGMVGLGPVTTSARDISVDGRIIVGAGPWRRGGSADIGLPPPARQQVFYQGIDGVLREVPANAGQDFPRLSSDGSVVVLQSGDYAVKWSPASSNYLNRRKRC